MSIDQHAETTSTLPQYRVYVLDREKRIRRAEVLQCADDQAAIDSARTMASGQMPGWSLELWQLARRVFSHKVGSMLSFIATDLSDGSLDLFGLL